jgi:hypothetical protein
MTQDQYGQTRGPGYVVGDDAVPHEENGEYAAGQSKPKTAFQKVASAIRGDRDEADQGQSAPDQAAGNQVVTSSEAATRSDVMTPSTEGTNADTSPGTNPPWVTQQDEAAMTDSPISREAPRQGDYWDEPGASAADRDEAVAVTSPDVPVTPGPSGAETGMGNGVTSAPYSEGPGGPRGPRGPRGEAGAATIADAPVTNTQAGGIPATGTAGRHAASADMTAASADTESRPGEAAGMLGDFSDLTYGNLIADTAVYVEQWQQVQFNFVDDPHGSVTEAADIVAQVTAKMEAAIQERQRAMQERQRAIAEQQQSLRGRWGEGTNADTEALRETLRMYKTFLDQLIGSSAR